MLFRKQKEGTGIGFRKGHGRSPLHRGSPRGVWLRIVLRQRKRKIQPLMGVRGLAPLDCLPHWGREGVTLAISTRAQKTRRISHEN
jgi:hypothetical protein